MWLIDTRTFELRFVMRTEDARFAILSHTWGEDEVVFQDMSNLEWASWKTGWHKIKKTCELALQSYGLEYAWIDTCCIDKTSSTELSEAINSMYAWYKASTVCFVWLSDYHGPDPTPQEAEVSLDSSEKIRELGKARWFSRGWTLQELVAPATIDFFDAAWNKIGTKHTLSYQLSAITGVDISVLADAEDLATVPVCKRMSWAADRETTRVEDIAYCLLGVFNVNMPLLYGEGSKAFLRLQQQIVQSNNDMTLFAWEQQHQSDSTSGIRKYRGIFAESPSEFRNCKLFKVPHGRRLMRANEFTLTNRGLRVDQNLAIGSDSLQELNNPAKPSPSAQTKHPARASIGYGGVGGKGLILGLDCLEESWRTQGKPRWIGVRLRQVGPNFVRELPDGFALASSRSQWRSVPAGERIAHIAPTLSASEARDIDTLAHIEIRYSESLCSIVLREPDHPEPVHNAAVSVAEGLFSFPLHLHVFAVRVGPSRKDEHRVAVVCGLQPHKSVNGRRTAGSALWAGIYLEDDLARRQDDTISNSDIFEPWSSTKSVLSQEEKLARFYDFIFENAADADGLINPDRLPNEVTIWGEGNPHTKHTISVHVFGDVPVSHESDLESQAPEANRPYLRVDYRS